MVQCNMIAMRLLHSRYALLCYCFYGNHPHIYRVTIEKEKIMRRRENHGISEKQEKAILSSPALTWDELEAWYDKISDTVYQTQADYDKEANAWYLAEQRMLMV